MFVEADPIPILAADEDVAESAVATGVKFPSPIARIARRRLGATRG